MRQALTDMANLLDAREDAADADRRFHTAIAAASHNDFLVSLMNQPADPFEQTGAAHSHAPAARHSP
jgi:DNA-binding FadR family transcriptional regulator